MKNANKEQPYKVAEASKSAHKYSPAATEQSLLYIVSHCVGSHRFDVSNSQEVGKAPALTETKHTLIKLYYLQNNLLVENELTL